MERVKIRKFRKGDEYAVAKIIREANRVTLKGFYPPALLKQMSADANARLIRIKAKQKNFKVAILKKRIVGLIGTTDNRIRSFFVHPVYQGLGIGKQLLEHAERNIKKSKVKFVQLNSSLFAVNFYKHHGYKKIKKINAKTAKGFPFAIILMKKYFKKS